MNLLLLIGLKGIGLLALAAVTCALLRNASATLRHRIWVLAFLCLTLLPILSIRLPEIRIERPVSSRRVTTTALQPPLLQAAPLRSIAKTSTPTPMPRLESETDLTGLILTIWGIGALLLACRTLYQLCRAAQLLRNGRSVDTEESLYLPFNTVVLQSSEIDVPMTLGSRRPAILLPTTSSTWPKDRLRSVLLHEAAHIRRGDWQWMIACRFVGCLYWPNPLVFWAEGKMRAESELAADEAVLESGIDATEYAATLVDLAEGLRRRSMGVALPFAEQSSLKSRIAAILKGARHHRPLQRSAAIFAVLLTVAVVVPYAAVRFVAGPTVIRDGVINLGDGRYAEIVAITEMRGKEAVSWDVHGALLPRPFPIEDMNLKTWEARPAPAGTDVRYVFIRMDDEAEANNVTLLSASGDGFEDQPYWGNQWMGGSIFEDALGGRYKVMRLIAPKGAKTASLSLKVPGSDWKLYASQDYANGDIVGGFNPMVGIHIAPQMPKLGKGTQAFFVLPSDISSDEACVRFLPTDAGSSRFDGVSGAQVASSSLRPEDVTRVEILTRSIQPIVLANLPMTPDPKAEYSPQRFLPSGLITAENGVAKLPDGTTVSIAKPKMGNQMQYGDLSAPKSPTIWLRTSPNRAQTGQILYDAEGWPLYRGGMGWNENGDQFWGYTPEFDGPEKKTDLVTRVPIGQPNTVLRLDRSTAKTYWSYEAHKTQIGGLKLNYPVELAARFAGMDTEIVPLGANGKPVTDSEKFQGSSYAAGWVEFNMTRDLADKVTAVEFRTRPYAWVEFRGVTRGPAKGH